MNKKRAWSLLPAALFVAALFVFGPSLSGPFLNWDDNIYITGSWAVQNMSWAAVKDAFGGIQFTDYAPLNTLGLSLQYKLWGPWPAGFRFTNLILHVLNASLVFAILSRLLGRRPLAAAGAFFFLLHPAQVEVVAWISQHKTLLSAALMFAAILSHLDRRPRALVVALAVSSMLVKPQAVILPLMLVLIDVLDGRKRLLPAAIDQAALFLFAAATAAANVLTQGSRGAVSSMHGGFLSHAWGVLQLPGRYVAKILAPYDLCPLYAIDHEAAGSVFFASLTVLLIALLVLALKSGRRLAALGLFFFFAALLPVLNIVPMVIWMADRYLYVPLLGALLAAGAIFPSSLFGWRRAAAFAAAILASVILGASTLAQSRIWASDTALWSETWRLAPGVVAGTNLASALTADGRMDDALPYADWVVAIAPSRPRGWANRGEIRRRAGLFRGAAGDFSMAVRLDPLNDSYRAALSHCLGRLGDLKDAPGKALR